MSQKPETRFIAAVHKLLPPAPYREKMSNPFRGGTPDVWYSGKLGDLWAEYKYLAKIPKSEAIDLGLSQLQRAWLDARYAEDRNVCVIVGSPEGCVILQFGAWAKPMSDRDFRSLMVPKDRVAEFIYRNTEADNAPPSVPSKRRSRRASNL